MNEPLPAAAPEPAAEAPPPCPHCGKIPALCVCADIVPFETKVAVVVIQHPQEQDRELGTARLALRHFAKGRLKIGLSWPNLGKVLGRPAEPKRWGVLYLGPVHLSAEAEARPAVVLDRHGEVMGDRAAEEVFAGLEGVILIDGSWSQAKTLWWRNPWLLKCWRIVLNPGRPSLYGRLRKEPRRDSVSTLEAAAAIMARLEKKPIIETRMLASFDALLHRYRALKAGR